jgi:glycosyltransferase involved in cell wall biosynthesis
MVWPGEGRLRQSILDHPNADRIRLLGHVWNLDELLDGADIFVLTSFHEGTPYALVEAMAKGLPIIATRAGGIPEALGDCGVLLPWPQDVEATGRLLAGEIDRLAADPAERKRLGEAARERAEAHFTASQELARYLELLA